MLAYINIYILMAYACFACLPLVFLLKKADNSAASPGMAH